MGITYVGFSLEMNNLNLMSAVDMEALRKGIITAVRHVHPSPNFDDSVVVHIVDRLGRGYEEDDPPCSSDC